eukprot:scaffold3943_cov123-Cylindrotheca_fusiformis.AAC.1
MSTFETPCRPNTCPRDGLVERSSEHNSTAHHCRNSPAQRSNPTWITSIHSDRLSTFSKIRYRARTPTTSGVTVP